MSVDAKGESPIYSDMLRGRREYFIWKVKVPLQKALIRNTVVSKGNRFLAKIQLLWDVWLIVRSINRFPEPTKENTKKHITHVLLDLWDEFEGYNTVKKPLFRAIRRITVCEVEHDVDYSQRMTWFLKRLTEKYITGEWNPLEPWAPFSYWTDPAVIEAVEIARQEYRTKLTIGGRPVGSVET